MFLLLQAKECSMKLIFSPNWKKNLIAVTPVFLIIIVAIYIPMIAVWNNVVESEKITNGIIDVSNFVDSNSLISLHGSVEFYPNKLISPTEFFINNPIEMPAMNSKGNARPSFLTNLPANWTQNSDPAKRMDAYGYGTYRFIINGLKPGQLYAFKIMDAATSYRFYVNDELISKNGKVATTASEYLPEVRPTIAVFTAKSDSIQVLMQIANFTKSYGGYENSLIFGEYEMLRKHFETILLTEQFMCLGVFVVALYHWILFVFMRKDKAVLYFSILCALVSMRTVVSGMLLLFQWFNGFNYQLGVAMAYLSTVWMVPLFLMYFNACFPWGVMSKVVKVSLATAIIESLVIIFLPMRIFQSTFVFYQLLILVYAVFIIFGIVRGWIRRVDNIRFFTFGFLVFLGTVVNDILESNHIINSQYLLSYGVFLFVFIQSTLLATRFAKAFSDVEELTHHLEKKVEDRTKELLLEKQRFEQMSLEDSMTGLYNRRHIMNMLTNQLENYSKDKRIFSLILIDLDNFKSINDKFGHAGGDKALIHVGSLLKENVAEPHIVSRFGGEEFLILLPSTGEDAAADLAEAIRDKINKKPILLGDVSHNVTASFGVSQADDNVLDMNDILHRVDMAMYKAKSLGKNRVVIGDFDEMTQEIPGA